jgi:hypothetical protein
MLWSNPALLKMKDEPAWRKQVQEQVRLREEARWRAALQQQSMLRTYRLIGGEGGMELERQFYLSVPHGGWNDRTLQGRRLLTQLRCGNSELHINTGRWEGLEREERLCELCAEETEDEAHFLLRCPLFAAERTELFSQMLPQSLAVDEDIVEEDQHELVEEGAEGLVHEVHEGGGGVGQTEGKYEELVVTVAGTEGSLRHVLVCDADLVVSGAKVDLAEDSGSLQAVEQFVNPGEGIAVLDGDVVESTIINTHTHGAVFLLHEQDGSTERRLGRSDEASGGQLGQLLPELGQLRVAEAICRATGRG